MSPLDGSTASALPGPTAAIRPRVVVQCRDRLLGDALVEWCGRQTPLVAVGPAADGTTLLHLCRTHRPVLVVLETDSGAHAVLAELPAPLPYVIGLHPARAPAPSSGPRGDPISTAAPPGRRAHPTPPGSGPGVRRSSPAPADSDRAGRPPPKAASRRGDPDLSGSGSGSDPRPGVGSVPVPGTGTGTGSGFAIRAGIPVLGDPPPLRFDRLVDRSAGLAGLTAAVHAFLVRGTAPGVARRSLTPRETEVLSLLGSGMRTAEIALLLGLSPRTVDNHRRRIYTKLGVQCASHAVAAAASAGLLALPEIVAQPIPLTPRERQILELADRGLSTKQTARLLLVSAKTVENTWRHLYGKLGVHGRAEALAIVHRWGT